MGVENFMEDAIAELDGEVSAQDVGADLSAADPSLDPDLNAKFDAVFGSDDGREPAEAEAAHDTHDAEAEGDEPERKPAVQPPATGKNRGEAKQGEPAVGGAAGLDPLLRQQAKRAGWSDEEIEQALALNAPAAIRQFEKLEADYAATAGRFAAMGAGTSLPAHNAGQSPAPSAPAAQPAGTDFDRLFTEEGLKEFAENNGQELVDKLLRPLQTEVLAPLRQVVQHYQAMQREALAKEVNVTFGQWENDFEDVYGKGEYAAVDETKQANRRQVMQLADQVRAGASAQGIELPVSEALERAHYLFNRHRQGEVERKKIADQVAKRSASITARPTQRKIAKTVEEGSGRSEEAAKEAVRAWWDANETD
jgi:hypothetical protein